MSDYLDELHDALTAAADRAYPRRAARPSRRRTRRAVLVALALGLVSASAAAALVALTRSSAPLTGSVPGAADHAHPAARLRYVVPVTPDLEPGRAGWCSYPSFAVTGLIDDSAGGTCSPAGPGDSPVILAGGEPIANERALLARAGLTLSSAQRRLTLVWLVVTDRVAAVRLTATLTVRARADRRLPAGWRAVVAFTSVAPDSIDPVALNAAGRPVRGAGGGGVAPAVPVDTVRPGSAGRSPCRLGEVRLPEVTAEWEVVARRLPAPTPAVAPATLVSCARAWFSIRGQSEAPSAALLLNARDPARVAPAPPGLTPTGTPGILADPSAELVAARQGPGWLVVQSRSPALGIRLLDALRARAVIPAG